MGEAGVVRRFAHGRFPCLPAHSGMSPDLAGVEGLALEERGRALLDVEFLTTATCGQAKICFYTSPCAYVRAIAVHFPRLHFYVCNPEYDPASPTLAATETRDNVTVANTGFDKELARAIGERRADEEMLLICHEERVTAERRMLYHTMSRPTYSLFRVDLLSGTFLRGELVLPIYASPSSSACYVLCRQQASSDEYDAGVLRAELGFFHALLRKGSTYDWDAEDQVLYGYARGDVGVAEYLRGRLPPVEG